MALKHCSLHSLEALCKSSSWLQVLQAQQQQCTQRPRSHHDSHHAPELHRSNVNNAFNAMSLPLQKLNSVCLKCSLAELHVQ
jgi:hypothetical protein